MGRRSGPGMAAPWQAAKDRDCPADSIWGAWGWLPLFSMPLPPVSTWPTMAWPPEWTWAYRSLTPFLAMAGDIEAALSAGRKLLDAHPDFTIQRYLAIPTFRDIPAFRDSVAASLRAAGLPEG